LNLDEIEIDKNRTTIDLHITTDLDFNDQVVDSNKFIDANFSFNSTNIVLFVECEINVVVGSN